MTRGELELCDAVLGGADVVIELLAEHAQHALCGLLEESAGVRAPWFRFPLTPPATRALPEPWEEPAA